MNYKKLIEDFNNGTIDKNKVTLVMDNDDSYFTVEDEDITPEEMDAYIELLKEKYGTSNGHSDIVNILNAAGVNSVWC